MGTTAGSKIMLLDFKYIDQLNGAYTFLDIENDRVITAQFRKIVNGGSEGFSWNYTTTNISYNLKDLEKNMRVLGGGGSSSSNPDYLILGDLLLPQQTDNLDNPLASTVLFKLSVNGSSAPSHVPVYLNQGVRLKGINVILNTNQDVLIRYLDYGDTTVFREDDKNWNKKAKVVEMLILRNEVNQPKAINWLIIESNTRSRKLLANQGVKNEHMLTQDQGKSLQFPVEMFTTTQEGQTLTANARVVTINTPSRIFDTSDFPISEFRQYSDRTQQNMDDFQSYKVFGDRITGGQSFKFSQGDFVTLNSSVLEYMKRPSRLQNGVLPFNGFIAKIFDNLVVHLNTRTQKLEFSYFLCQTVPYQMERTVAAVAPFSRFDINSNNCRPLAVLPGPGRLSLFNEGVAVDYIRNEMEILVVSVSKVEKTVRLTEKDAQEYDNQHSYLENFKKKAKRIFEGVYDLLIQAVDFLISGEAAVDQNKQIDTEDVENSNSLSNSDKTYEYTVSLLSMELTDHYPNFQQKDNYKLFKTSWISKYNLMPISQVYQYFGANVMILVNPDRSHLKILINNELKLEFVYTTFKFFISSVQAFDQILSDSSKVLVIQATYYNELTKLFCLIRWDYDPNKSVMPSTIIQLTDFFNTNVFKLSQSEPKSEQSLLTSQNLMSCNYMNTGIIVNKQNNSATVFRIQTTGTDTKSLKMFYFERNTKILAMACSKNGKTAAIVYSQSITSTNIKQWVKVVNLEQIKADADLNSKVNWERKFTILETELFDFEPTKYRLGDPGECTIIVNLDNLIVSCSKNTAQLAPIYRKYSFETTMVDINTFSRTLISPKMGDNGTCKNRILQGKIIYKVDIGDQSFPERLTSVTLIENDSIKIFKKTVIQTQTTDGKFTKIELIPDSPRRRIPIELKVKIVEPVFNIALKSVDPIPPNSWILEPRLGPWSLQAYKGISQNRDTAELCLLNPFRLLDENGKPEGEHNLKQLIKVPGTFLKSSRLHIDDLREMGRRAIVIVQNMQSGGYIVFMSFIASLHGNRLADKAIPILEYRSSSKLYSISSSMSYTPNNPQNLNNQSIYVAILTKQAETHFSLFFIYQRIEVKIENQIVTIKNDERMFSGNIPIPGDSYSEVKIAVLSNQGQDQKQQPSEIIVTLKQEQKKDQALILIYDPISKKIIEQYEIKATSISISKLKHSVVVTYTSENSQCVRWKIFKREKVNSKLMIFDRVNCINYKNKILMVDCIPLEKQTTRIRRNLQGGTGEQNNHITYSPVENKVQILCSFFLAFEQAVVNSITFDIDNPKSVAESEFSRKEKALSNNADGRHTELNRFNIYRRQTPIQIQTSSKYTMIMSYSKHQANSLTISIYRHSQEVFFLTDIKSSQSEKFQILLPNSSIIQGLNQKRLADLQYIIPNCIPETIHNDLTEAMLGCAPRFQLDDRYVFLQGSTPSNPVYDLETEISFLKADSSLQVNCVTPIHLVVPEKPDIKKFLEQVSFFGEEGIEIEQGGIDKNTLLSSYFTFKQDVKPEEQKKTDPTNPNSKFLSHL